jgi:hypothetical protein
LSPCLPHEDAVGAVDVAGLTLVQRGALPAGTPVGKVVLQQDPALRNRIAVLVPRRLCGRIRRVVVARAVEGHTRKDEEDDGHCRSCDAAALYGLRSRHARSSGEVAEALAASAGGQHGNETDQVQHRQPIHASQQGPYRDGRHRGPTRVGADHPDAEQQLADGLPDGQLERKVVDEHQHEVQRQPCPIEREREPALVHRAVADRRREEGEQCRPQRQIDQGGGNPHAEQILTASGRVRGLLAGGLRGLRDAAHRGCGRS